MVRVQLYRQGMNASQNSVLVSDKSMYVCECVWAHSAQSALPFFTPVGKTPLSKTWLNGCISLSHSLSLSYFLTLSPSHSTAVSLSLSLSLSLLHVSTDHRFVLPSPPCCPAKRESPSRHHHRQRDGPGTQIGRDTPREGGGGGGAGGGKCTRSSCPTPLSCLSLFFSLGRPTAAEWWGRDVHWHRVCDTRWLMVKTFEERYDLNSVIYVIIP